MKINFYTKTIILILFIVTINAAGMFFLIVPLVKENAFQMEENYVKAQLDKIYDLIKRTDEDLKTYKQESVKRYQNKLKDLTMTVESQLYKFYELYKTGKLTEEEAKKQALNWVKDLRYGKNDYFFISDYNSVLISHPELMNKDFSEVKDVYGTIIVPNLVKKAREEHEGFTTYWWRRLGQERPSEKLTYSRHFPAWQWVFGTGVYIDDIETEIQKKKEQLFDKLREIIKKTKIAKTGYMYIFDQSHNLIIHPNSNIEGKNLRQMKMPRTDDRYITTELMKAAESTKELYYYWDRLEDPGNYSYYKISWIKYYEPLGLYICSSAYIDELNASSEQIKTKIIYISSILLLISIGFGFLVSRKLIRPIELLGEAAKKIGSGNLTVRSNIKSNDEIGLLSREFDEMIDKLVASQMAMEHLNKNLEDTVDMRTMELTEQKEKISALLDHSDEGFLMINNDLSVDSEYSNECINIFKKEISGLKLDDLLFDDTKSATKEHFRKNMQGLFNEKDSFKIECILSLMPSEFSIHNHYYKIKYKLIDSNRMMLIMFDITKQKKLEKAIERERKRLKLVVTAVRYKNEIVELIHDYEEFCHLKASDILNKDSSTNDIFVNIYRKLHTLKGNFAQFEFIALPETLHKMEQELLDIKEQNRLSKATLLETVNFADCRRAFEEDISVLKESLGRNFMETSKTFCATQYQLTEILRLLREAMAQAPAIKELLQGICLNIETIQSIDIKTMLAPYSKMSLQLAHRLGKELEPFEIEGDTILVKPELYQNVTKNMVHLFRNAVDHGLELPDERNTAGKDETGKISCTVSRKDYYIEIVLKDDGRGVDTDKLRQKISTQTDADAQKLSDDEIMEYLFVDGITTKDSATELSGRGVGMSALKASIEELGGTITVSSEKGAGTTFTIAMPYLH